MKLKYPIEIDGKTVADLTFRRAKAKDMIVIGDHMGALAALDVDKNNPAAAAKAMSGDAYRAMIVIVGMLSDIGEDAAGELDFEDLIEAVTEAMDGLGEADGSDGEAPNGE